MISRKNWQSFSAQALLSLCLCFSFTSAFAQTALTGGLRGNITDKNNAAVPGAQVTVSSRSLGVKHNVVTDGSGRFTFLGLTPASDYEVTIVGANFKPATRNGIEVVSETTVTADVALEIVAVNETVNITATDTTLATTPEVSTVLEAQRLTQLPSNGRNLTRFALLNAHVRNTSPLGGDASAQGRLSINGGIFRDTHHRLDGSSNTDALFNNSPLQAVSIAAVQEFKVLTNQFSAEYGGTSAGFTVTTTKSGTNDLHGEAFFFGRPSGIQARPPVASLRIPNQLLQYGASLGGALKKDRVFYFANYERTQQERGAFLQERRFLKDNSLLFPASVHIGAQRDQLALLKLDARLNDRHSLALRLNGNRNFNDNINDRVSGITRPSNAQVNAVQNTGVQVNDTYSFGKLINELRITYANAMPSNSYPLTASTGVSRPGLSTEGFSSFSNLRQQNYQFVDQVSAQFGRHVVRFGGDYIRQKLHDRSFDLFGTYVFPTCDVSATGDTSVTCLAKKPTQFRQLFGKRDLNYAQTRVAGFVQDDWRLTSRLTLNLGLRYDFQSIVGADKNNFGPRLGFAYELNDKTVVRGGAGVYYDQPYMHGFTQRFFLNAPQAVTATYTLTPTDAAFPTFPNSLTNLAGATAARDLILPGENMRSPYTIQFAAGFQRKLFGEWVATADVIHHGTRKQYLVFDLNAPAPFVRTAPGQVRSAADSKRPYSNYNQLPFRAADLNVPIRNVRVAANGNTSNYDALDLALRRRFAARYQLEAHYVYSSAISTMSDDHMGANPNEWSQAIRGERAFSTWHQRHRFVANGMAALPWRTNLTLVSTLASGLPVNAITGVDNNGDSVIQDRPVGFGRNAFRTPRHLSFDASLSKRLPLFREKAQLELRADVFNLTNHSNYYQLNNVYGNGATPAATFLTPLAGISNVDPGRQFQFAMRMIF